MVKNFNFKDLKKLGTQINGMCAFADQIKERVTGDLAQISGAKDFINSVQTTLKDMNAKLADAEQTLTKLSELLQ
jgi:hypothetical protein